MRILIVDDEPKIGRLLAAELGDAGFDAEATTDPRAALERIRRDAPDVLLTDVRMDAMNGLELMRAARGHVPDLDVVVMTAYASVETAVEAMKQGAWDYIVKPFETDALILLMRRIAEKRRMSAQNEGLRRYTARGGETLVGESEAMRRVRELIANLAESDAAVLIRGESGTGKELVARAIHAASRRASGAFIALNCAAIPDTLLESELFGYERGAFTGATRRKPGHFQMADGGTLFLDEIGDLPLGLQAKLLRVLETRRVTPLGGVRDVEVDIRLVSATHRPLETLMREGTFREDLYYRLNVFPIVIPPLRERREDIRPLAAHFLAEWGRPASDLGDDALARLVAYDWPGNVRELRNVLERATILRPQGRIGAGDVLLGEASMAAPSTPREDAFDTLDLAETERRLIRRALEVARGNKSEAARLLGITRRTLYGRLERYGMLDGGDEEPPG